MGWQDAKDIKIVTKNFGVPKSTSWPPICSAGGWDGFRRALTFTPASHHRRGQEVQPARPRRRRLPHRDEVVLRAQGGQAGLPGVQRRRVRARHLQGPRAAGLDPAPADRGHGHRVVRARLQTRVHLYPRRDDPRGAHPPGRHRRSLRSGLAGQGSPGGQRRSSVSTSPCTGARAPTSAARRPALLNSLEGKRGWPRLKPPFPAVRGLFQEATIVNNVETLMNIPDIIRKGGDWFAAWAWASRAAPASSASRATSSEPGVFELPMGIPFRELIYDVCGGISGSAAAQGADPGRHARCRLSTPARSTSPSSSTP